MIVAVCVSDDWGLAFNNRRLSRDKEIYIDLIKYGKTIFVDKYSSPLFPQGHTAECEDFSALKKDDIAFIERNVPKCVKSNIDKLIIYRFNRKYPFDSFFDIDLSTFTLVEKYDFKGNSHDVISKEVYTR